jgi:sugar phosphate isomerase/epimerase
LLKGRGFPVQATSEVAAFFDALKKVGYNGTMSIEGKAQDLEKDAGMSLRALRSLG